MPDMKNPYLKGILRRDTGVMLRVDVPISMKSLSLQEEIMLADIPPTAKETIEYDYLLEAVLRLIIVDSIVIQLLEDLMQLNLSKSHSLDASVHSMYKVFGFHIVILCYMFLSWMADSYINLLLILRCFNLVRMITLISIMMVMLLPLEFGFRTLSYVYLFAKIVKETSMLGQGFLLVFTARSLLRCKLASRVDDTIAIILVTACFTFSLTHFMLSILKQYFQINETIYIVFQLVLCSVFQMMLLGLRRTLPKQIKLHRVVERIFWFHLRLIWGKIYINNRKDSSEIEEIDKLVVVIAKRTYYPLILFLAVMIPEVSIRISSTTWLRIAAHSSRALLTNRLYDDKLMFPVSYTVFSINIILTHFILFPVISKILKGTVSHMCRIGIFQFLTAVYLIFIWMTEFYLTEKSQYPESGKGLVSVYNSLELPTSLSSADFSPNTVTIGPGDFFRVALSQDQEIAVRQINIKTNTYAYTKHFNTYNRNSVAYMISTHGCMKISGAKPILPENFPSAQQSRLLIINSLSTVYHLQLKSRLVRQSGPSKGITRPSVFKAPGFNENILISVEPDTAHVFTVLNNSKTLLKMNIPPAMQNTVYSLFMFNNGTKLEINIRLIIKPLPFPEWALWIVVYLLSFACAVEYLTVVVFVLDNSHFTSYCFMLSIWHSTGASAFAIISSFLPGHVSYNELLYLSSAQAVNLVAFIIFVVLR